MMGGAGIIAPFIDAGEIDKFMFDIIPQVYMRRHSTDRRAPSHHATKIYQAALCGRQVVLVPEGHRQTRNS
jgi:hypothetical protein